MIREQDPLKQGLKLKKMINYRKELCIREQDPLKQGLKRSKCIKFIRAVRIREQDPLKQGLKHLDKIVWFFIIWRFASKIH